MDLYNLLNIKSNSSAEEIKKAYRRASLKHHPDRGGNAEEFKKINRAYEVLSDPIKKRDYDFKKNNNFYGGDNSNIFNNEMDIGGGDQIPDLFKMFFGGMPMGMNPEVFSNIERNASFFGGHPNIPSFRVYKNGKQVFTNKKAKPVEITKTIKIDLEKAYTGTNFPLEVERYIISNNVKTLEKETIYIDIPKGIDSNEIINIEGKGNVNADGMKGDIKVYIVVSNSTSFERQGLDLVYKKIVSLKEALTGFTFELEHLNGKKYKINNSSVIKPGYQSVVSGMGMNRADKVGRMIIEFDVNFPKNLSDEQKEKLKIIL